MAERVRNPSSPAIRDVEGDLIATMAQPSLYHKLTVFGLIIVLLWGGWCYLKQVRMGLAATAMSDYFSWGIYIVNFVFFIGISMAGTLISAMLRIFNAPWRFAITRLSEAVTVFALLVAGPMVIIDMGRPDRFFFVGIYGRLQSPILWDVMSLTTYLAGSLLFLYLPLIPDMAILRDRPGFSWWRRRLYTTLAMNWQGTPAQRKALDRAEGIMTLVILPVAVSIHTVTAWLFGMTLRPGWHTAIIGPDFVVGALYSGVAAVITAIVLFRHFFHLQKYINAEHFKYLGRMLLAFGFVYAYFVVNEHAASIYTGEVHEQGLDEAIFGGPYAITFWAMVTIGLVLPLVMLVTPLSKRIGGILAASLLVNVGMWLKRYVIVIPTLASPYMPHADKTLRYAPTLVEWSITAGAFAAFVLMYIWFSKVFPIVGIAEMKAHAAAANESAPIAGTGEALA